MKVKYTEEKLIQGIKRGDEVAFRQLFDIYYARLSRIAAQYVNDDFIADTLVGDFFFHLWENRTNLVIETSLNAYLIRSIRNSAINYLHKNYVEKEIEFPTGLETSLSTGEYPLGILLEKELEDMLESQIEQLPAETRKVFILSRLDGLKNTEIADTLHISVNTVKYHIKQALTILREKLKGYF